MVNKDRKKIFLDSDEDVSLVLKRFLKIKEPELVLNIPRNSLISNLDHFQLLRRKANEAGKKLFVESVDDHVLEVSELAGLRAVNPVFKTRGRPVADILPVRINRPKNYRINDDNDDDNDKTEETGILIGRSDDGAVAVVRHRKFQLAPTRSAVFIRLGFLVSLMGLGYWMAFFVLPQATVTLELKKYSNAFAEPVRANVNVPSVQRAGESILLPGEILKSVKNMEMSFPAVNKADVKRPAEGKITVFNAYSSAPQSLVAKTRFESGDGKIFRLQETVKIPGAEIVDGKIKPASVEVAVVADSPGSEHNIGPVDKWTIPGFKSTPKYDGFYAKSDGPMRGGMIGYQAVPTEEETVAAKKKMREAILEALKGETKVLMTDNFEVLEGTTLFQVKKEEVYPTPDSETNFSVFMEAEMKQMVFDKEMLSGALIDKNKELFAGEEIKLRARNFVFQYEGVNANVANGEVSFTAKGNVVFERDLETAELAASLIGSDLRMIKEKVNSLAGVQSTKVKLWPFWVRKAPRSSGKVRVVTE